MDCRIFIQMRSDFASNCERLLQHCAVERLLFGRVLERIITLHKEVGYIEQREPLFGCNILTGSNVLNGND